MARDEGLLRLQGCESCGLARSPARFVCLRCGSDRWTLVEACGLAIVRATTEVLRAPSDTFRELVPYTLILAELQEGPRVMGHGEHGLAIGQPVRAHAFQHAGMRLVHFRAQDA